MKFSMVRNIIEPPGNLYKCFPSGYSEVTQISCFLGWEFEQYGTFKNFQLGFFILYSIPFEYFLVKPHLAHNFTCPDFHSLTHTHNSTFIQNTE